MPNSILLVNAQAPCLSVSATTTASTSAALPSKGETLRIVNEGPSIAYISVGSGSQTATVPGSTAANTCTPIAVGDSSFSIPSDQVLQISAITASGTATLRVQVTTGS